MPANPSVRPFALSQAGNSVPAFCTRPRPAVPPRLLAAACLLVLLVRLLLPVYGLRAAAAWQAIALPGLLTLLLGGCLWWVAHRQVGAPGALLALVLYCTAPAVASQVQAGYRGPGAALGLFAMLFTAVGVAHALQGPRRKWRKRIVLMSALCAFTGLVQPVAGAVALVLALCAMLYVAEQHRRMLPALFLLWSTAAFLPWLAYRSLVGRGLLRSLDTLAWFAGGDPPAAHYGRNAGLLLALLAALALWTAARRSRYFGNTGPLVAAVVLGCAGAFVVGRGMAWAIPFILLFVAGAFADGMETERREPWIVAAVGLGVLQLLLGLLT